MAYDEYQTFLQQYEIRSGSGSSNSGTKSSFGESIGGVGVRDLRFSRGVVMKAFEHLIVVGLLKVCSDRGGGAGSSGIFYGHGLKEYRMVKPMFTADQASGWIKCLPDVPTILSKWCVSFSSTN